LRALNAVGWALPAVGSELFNAPQVQCRLVDVNNACTLQDQTGQLVSEMPPLIVKLRGSALGRQFRDLGLDVADPVLQVKSPELSVVDVTTEFGVDDSELAFETQVAVLL